MDKRCYSDLQNLLTACKEAGHSPTIVAAYRSHADQKLLYDQALQILLDQGNTEEAAAQALVGVVDKPGESEHQTGLAVDIVDAMNQNLDASQHDAAIGQWLAENAWKYGFIQRDPADAPWHYRYVGQEVAAEIQEQGVSFEEYLASFA